MYVYVLEGVHELLVLDTIVVVVRIFNTFRSVLTFSLNSPMSSKVVN